MPTEAVVVVIRLMRGHLLKRGDMIEYRWREEAACGRRSSLDANSSRVHERFQIPLELCRKPPAEGSHLHNELDAQGQGQIHLGWLSSQLPSIVSDPLVSHTSKIQGARGGWRGCGGLALALLAGVPLSPLTEQPNLRSDPVYRVRFIAFPKNRVIPQQGKRQAPSQSPRRPLPLPGQIESAGPLSDPIYQRCSFLL